MYLIYNAAQAEDPYLSKVLRAYSNWNEEWIRRNDIHDAAVQQAIKDRTLFLDRPRLNEPGKVFTNPEYVASRILSCQAEGRFVFERSVLTRNPEA